MAGHSEVADGRPFHAALLAWYDQHGRRDLPWRVAPTPYRVWLSEIMLQQTQVATVLPYFERFLQRFPDLASLAEAPLEEVLTQWAGLGYYSRARNLHRAAQMIAADRGGRFPADLEALAALPGIGRSTAGAILAIAFRQKAPILDGNVKRVLARWAGIGGWPGEAAVSRELWALSDRLTPADRVGDYTQAIMDLGATLCTRSKPCCGECPISGACVARREGLTATLPTPRPTKVLPIKTAFFLALNDTGGRVYLERQPAPGLWGGLWSFPRYADWADLETACAKWNVALADLTRLSRRRHTFSHFHLDYVPVLAPCSEPPLRIAEADDARWLAPEETLPPLPTPIRRLLHDLRNF